MQQLWPCDRGVRAVTFSPWPPWSWKEVEHPAAGRCGRGAESSSRDCTRHANYRVLSRDRARHASCRILSRDRIAPPAGAGRVAHRACHLRGACACLRSKGPPGLNQGRPPQIWLEQGERARKAPPPYYLLRTKREKGGEKLGFEYRLVRWMF